MIVGRDNVTQIRRTGERQASVIADFREGPGADALRLAKCLRAKNPQLRTQL